MGSNKNAPKTSDSASQSGKGVCLFAPEGTVNEVRLMAEIALEAAIANPLQIFVLRLHPVLSRDKVLKVLKQLQPFPANFLLSKNGLSVDLISSSWICYRGSSVVFKLY